MTVEDTRARMRAKYEAMFLENPALMHDPALNNAARACGVEGLPVLFEEPERGLYTSLT
jgi:hypothetical protein